MFTGYNKNNAKGALVGNWVEEEALRSGTGFSRRKVPAPYFAPDRKESRHEPTRERVLAHTIPAETTASAFETTNQASTRYGDFAVQCEPAAPRSSRREMAMIEQAKRICEQQEQQRQADEQSQVPTGTLTQSSYLPLDPALLASATRVPRGRNGSRVMDPAIQHLTKKEVDSIDQMKLNLLQGDAVTRYSYAVATGVGLNFAMTASDSANPFGRSSAFSNEIADPTKRHGEATEPGSLLDERVGTTVHQRAALKQLLVVLEQDPAVAKQLTDKLTSRSQGEFVQISDFRSAWREVLGTNRPGLKEKDAIHVFMYFDVQSIGAIHLPQFIEFCRSGALQQQQQVLPTRST